MLRKIIMTSLILIILVSVIGCSPIPLRYTLSVSVTPENSGTVTPSHGSYLKGATVTLTANPTAGYIFSHWEGDASGSSNPLTVTMNNNKNITAVFEEDFNSVPGITGIVKDAYTNLALSGVTVSVYSSTSVLVASGATDINGSYSLQFDAGNDYNVQFSKAGFLTVNYFGINVSGATYLETILQIDNTYSGTGNVSGKIIDGTVQGGTTGVDGVTINLRAGMNAKTGTIIDTTTSNADGTYSFTGLTAGNYTAELIKTDWTTTYFSIICLNGVTTGDQNGTITPVLSAGETRIVLTWGANPSDLDSHLTGPIVPGDTSYFDVTGRFHIYFINQTYEYNSNIQAELDVDDTISYGPETTTIHIQQSGIYRYSVYDYSDQYDSENLELANSGAQVKVYRNNVLVRTFYVPTGRKGTLWTVFELNGDTITPINTITYHNGYSGDVRSLQSHTDAGLMRNMPSK